MHVDCCGCDQEFGESAVGFEMVHMWQAASVGQQPQQLGLPDWLLKDEDGVPITEVGRHRNPPLFPPPTMPSPQSHRCVLGVMCLHHIAISSVVCSLRVCERVQDTSNATRCKPYPRGTSANTSVHVNLRHAPFSVSISPPPLTLIKGSCFGIMSSTNQLLKIQITDPIGCI